MVTSEWTKGMCAHGIRNSFCLQKYEKKVSDLIPDFECFKCINLPEYHLQTEDL